MLKRRLQTANCADPADRADRTDRTDGADCKLCGPRRPCRPYRPYRRCRPRFVGSRISTVSFRETLTNSFMTYHAIDFDKYPILQYYAVIFSLRKKMTFSRL